MQNYIPTTNNLEYKLQLSQFADYQAHGQRWIGQPPSVTERSAFRRLSEAI